MISPAAPVVYPLSGRSSLQERKTLALGTVGMVCISRKKVRDSHKQEVIYIYEEDELEL